MRFRLYNTNVDRAGAGPRRSHGLFAFDVKRGSAVTQQQKRGGARHDIRMHGADNGLDLLAQSTTTLLLRSGVHLKIVQDRNFNRARSGIRRTSGAIADPARAGGRAAAYPPPAAAPRWPSGRCFPRAPGRRGDRSDAPMGLTRTPNIPARERGVGVRLNGPGGPQRAVAWRPVQTVPGSGADSARRRGPPSRRGCGGARGSGRSPTVA